MIYAGSECASPRARLWAAGATRRVIKDRWSKGVRCEELGVRSKPDPKPAHQTPMLNMRERGSEQLGLHLTPYASPLTPNADGAPQSRIWFFLIERCELRLRMKPATESSHGGIDLGSKS